MFFTRYILGEDEQLIMKSNMDGSKEGLLLDMSFYSSISLNVDEWTETVYWWETKLQVLHSVSMNGINHRVKWHICIQHFIIYIEYKRFKNFQNFSGILVVRMGVFVFFFHYGTTYVFHKETRKYDLSSKKYQF